MIAADQVGMGLCDAISQPFGEGPCAPLIRIERSSLLQAPRGRKDNLIGVVKDFALRKWRK